MKLSDEQQKVLLEALDHYSKHKQECLWECEDDGRESGARINKRKIEVLEDLTLTVGEK